MDGNRGLSTLDSKVADYRVNLCSEITKGIAMNKVEEISSQSTISYWVKWSSTVGTQLQARYDTLMEAVAHISRQLNVSLQLAHELKVVVDGHVEMLNTTWQEKLMTEIDERINALKYPYYSELLCC